MDRAGTEVGRRSSGVAGEDLFHPTGGDWDAGAAGVSGADLGREADAGSGWQEASYLALRRVRDHLTAAPVGWLARLGVPPSAVSLAGVAAAATLLWTLPGRSGWALAAFLTALVCDAMDGALARRLGRASARGKLVDQACDLATCAAVLGAVAVAGRAEPVLAAGAGALLAALLAAAMVHNSVRGRPRLRGRRRRRLVPRGGFFAHLPKAPLYGAVVLWLVGGPDWIAPAVAITGTVAGLTLLGFLAVLTPRPGRR